MPTIRFDRKPPGVDSVEWYKDATGAFSAGYWTHEGGVLEVDYTEHEFCLLLGGQDPPHRPGGPRRHLWHGRRLRHPDGVQRHLGDTEAGAEVVRDLAAEIGGKGPAHSVPAWVPWLG